MRLLRRLFVDVVIVMVLYWAFGMITALREPRTRTVRMIDMANVRSIGAGMWKYAQEHGAYPSNMSSLYPRYLTNVSVFASPLRGGKPGDASKIDEWTDYVLLAPRYPTNMNPMVLAFGKPHLDRDGGSSILFTDGSVQWWSSERLIDGLIRKTP